MIFEKIFFSLLILLPSGVLFGLALEDFDYFLNGTFGSDKPLVIRLVGFFMGAVLIGISLCGFYAVVEIWRK